MPKNTSIKASISFYHFLNDLSPNKRSLARFKRIRSSLHSSNELWCLDFEVLILWKKLLDDCYWTSKHYPREIFGMKLYHQQISRAPTVISVEHDIVLSTKDGVLTPGKRCHFLFTPSKLLWQIKQIFLLPKLHRFNFFTNCAHHFAYSSGGSYL